MAKATTKNFGSERVVHMVDCDNILGTSRPTRELIAAVMPIYFAQVGYKHGDQLTLAANDHSAKSIFFGIDLPAHRVIGYGPDGADHRMIEEMLELADRGNTPRLTLGSGDAIFADVVGNLQRSGTHVTVASLPYACAAKLRLAANTMIDLEVGVFNAGSVA